MGANSNGYDYARSICAHSTKVQRDRSPKRARQTAENSHNFAFFQNAAAYVHLSNQGKGTMAANPGV